MCPSTARVFWHQVKMLSVQQMIVIVLAHSVEPATSSTRAAATRRGSSLGRSSALTLAALRELARDVHQATSRTPPPPITQRNRALRAGILQGQTITKVYLTVRRAILLVPPEVIAHHKLQRAQPVKTEPLLIIMGLNVKHARETVRHAGAQQRSVLRVSQRLIPIGRKMPILIRARALVRPHAKYKILTSPQPMLLRKRSVPSVATWQTGA